MRKVIYLSILAFLTCCLFACNGKGGNPQPFTGKLNPQLLLGKWTLQHHKFVQYVNDVKQIDTTINASVSDYSNINFYSNNKYTNVSISGWSGGLNQIALDSISGTYSLAGSNFSLSASVTGFIFSPPFFSSGTVPVITPISNSARIDELTAYKLTLHTEVSYSLTSASTEAKTYKMMQDLYYTK